MHKLKRERSRVVTATKHQALEPRPLSRRVVLLLGPLLGGRHERTARHLGTHVPAIRSLLLRRAPAAHEVHDRDRAVPEAHDADDRDERDEHPVRHALRGDRLRVLRERAEERARLLRVARVVCGRRVGGGGGLPAGGGGGGRRPVAAGLAGERVVGVARLALGGRLAVALDPTAVETLLGAERDVVGDLGGRGVSSDVGEMWRSVLTISSMPATSCTPMSPREAATTSGGRPKSGYTISCGFAYEGESVTYSAVRSTQRPGPRG